MRIYLMRHGDAEDGIVDFERPLSSKGEQEAEIAGRYLSRVREIPDVIFHSPLVRAAQTSRGVVRGLGFSPEIYEREGIAPDDDPVKFARELALIDEGQNVLVITHLPFVARLASAMMSCEMGLRFRFTTGAIAGFEQDLIGDTIWRLRFFYPGKAMSRALKGAKK